MSDLSRLLDDVYRAPASRSEPAWSSDSALDEVFANWIPGPAAPAPEPARTEVRDDPVVVPTTVVPAWSRSADDILPDKATRRFTLRRR
jgi:hypothetical protein